MGPNISITLITPHVTIERYSELTGLAEETINDMLADGRLPRHRLRKDKKREKVMINLMPLFGVALTAKLKPNVNKPKRWPQSVPFIFWRGRLGRAILW